MSLSRDDLCPACGTHDCPGADGYGCPDIERRRETDDADDFDWLERES